jgi:hypothetical protein
MLKAVKTVWLVMLFLLANLGLIGLALASSGATATTSPLATPPSTPIAMTQIRGAIVDAKGAVVGATVRVQATENKTVSSEDGSFALDIARGTKPITITASAEGYYIGWTTVMPNLAASRTPITITLDAHYLTDNFTYDWFVHTTVDGSQIEGSAACGECHTAYPEWLGDAHAQAAVNPRFLTLYTGTDVHGNRSPKPETNSLGIPILPDLAKPYYGPGFKLDFPNRAGSCATCHTPMAAKFANKTNCTWSGCHSDTTAANAQSLLAPGTLDPGVSPLALEGDAAEGISCEFCHKIGDVYIERNTGLPYPDLPGILSLRLYRPEAGHDLFFGPLDDIARADIEAPRDVHLPLMQESAFCAGCHYGILGGVVVGTMEVKGGVLIYSSYEEWLNTPYSDPETGATCQDCHMPSLGLEYAVYLDRGGMRRDKMLGASDREFMQNALTLTAKATLTGTLTDCQVAVEVSVTNDETGHHVPTDSPLRHVMLIVEAIGANNKPLMLTDGPRLPEWAGNYAGLPGQSYAKILEDEWSGEKPSAQIWRPVRVVEDTRLAALATDVSYYTFDAPAHLLNPEPTKLHVRLIYRRAFQQLMEWKGWSDPDILMEELTLTVADGQEAQTCNDTP